MSKASSGVKHQSRCRQRPPHFEPSAPGAFGEPSGWGELDEGGATTPAAEPAGSTTERNFMVGGRRDEDHAELAMPVNGNGAEAREIVAAVGRLSGDAPRREGKG